MYRVILGEQNVEVHADDFELGLTNEEFQRQLTFSLNDEIVAVFPAGEWAGFYKLETNQ